MKRRDFLLATASAPLAAAAAAAGPDAYPASPEAVVRAYCESDYKGDQTASETWPKLAQYAVWPDAPGWDTFTIVTGYTVSRGRHTARSATVRVVYDVLGVLEGEEARRTPERPTVLYRLVRRGGRWKVASPQLEPHVSTNVALRILDGLEHNQYVAPDLEKVRASRALVLRMAGQ
jgi:hypothetical protein